MGIGDAISQLIETKGRAAYYGEAVSQAEHALQSAHLDVPSNSPVGIPMHKYAVNFGNTTQLQRTTWLGVTFGGSPRSSTSTPGPPPSRAPSTSAKSPTGRAIR